MNLKKCLFVIVVLALIFLSSGKNLIAEPSLLPEHTLTIDNVTLIRDFKNPGRWYYVVERPELVERDPANTDDPRPAFQFMTYQAEKDENLYQGGMLQFSVSLKLAEEKKKTLVKKLRSEMKYKSKDFLEIVALPFRMAHATLYDAGGHVLANAPQSPGLAPPYITGALPFQIKLDEFGADLYQALINAKNSGAGVLIQLAFEGMLPPAGFKVTMNYDQSYKYIKENKNFQFQIGEWFLGASTNIDRGKIRKELVQNKCLTFESLTNEAVKEELLNKYMDPVLSRMCEEFFNKIEVPEAIDIDKSREPDLLDKCFFIPKFRVRTELKEINLVRKGSQTFDFNVVTVAERRTSCGTFVGINSYSESVKKKLVSTMPLNSGSSAFLMLPDVDSSPELNISGVSMSADVIDRTGKQVSGLTDTASWSEISPQSWKDKDGSDTYSLKFPLLALFDRHNNDLEATRKEYRFKVTVILEQKLDRLNTVRISYETPLFNGDLPLAQPVDLVQNVVFDLSLLDFDSEEGIRKARVEVLQGNNRMQRTVKKTDSKTVVFIAGAGKAFEATPLTANLFFDESKRGGQRNISWQHNGEELKNLEPGLFFLLFDSDWKKTD